MLKENKKFKYILIIFKLSIFPISISFQNPTNFIENSKAHQLISAKDFVFEKKFKKYPLHEIIKIVFYNKSL
jgi:hypothetical protein